MTTRLPEVRCARCFTLAEDIDSLDPYWADGDVQSMDEDEVRRQRIEYVREMDGTYNRATGSFWCDKCYVAIGAPLGVAP